MAVNTLAPDRSQLEKQLKRQGYLNDPAAEPSLELEDLKRSLNERLASLSAQPLELQRASNFRKANNCPCEDEEHPSRGWRRLPHHLAKAQLWERIRHEAQQDAASEPALASNLYSTVLAHDSIESTFAFLLSNKLANLTILPTQLMSLIKEAYTDDPDIVEAGLADLQAVFDRDPACDKYTQAMLYFKGYQAVQCHRIAHWLWNKGRRALALALQSRISETFHVDIHPGAQLGRGILLDHATGVVIGETAVLGDNVSMLHHVTLGGSGTGTGVRHPTVGHGVLIGAGANILGPVSIGAGSKIGAGSVVVTDLPCHCVAVGVPARIVKMNILTEPVKDMDQCCDFILDYVI